VPRQLCECIPNYSEGRRPEVIESIVAPFRSAAGVHLLDTRADADHNRLVVSLVGEPGPLEDALLASARAAIASIDMREHAGAHPRIGAVDVVPFVPLRGMTMDDCVSLARAFGRRYAAETGVPVYFYEEAALRPERRGLEVVRRGQWEALREEIGTPERLPDAGEPRLHPTAGATAVGARAFLVAFNVYLDTRDMGLTKSIARSIRASGGGMPHVKAVAVDLAARGLTQVSINITDAEEAPLLAVLERVRAEARSRGARVVETEIYGMVPAAALLETAARALQLAGFDPSQVLELALLERTLPGVAQQGRALLGRGGSA
jgi:glutamate formiminotransferase / 5-formyltetrahydrofolate cyclo-ligase